MADLATTGLKGQESPARLDPYRLRADFPILATLNRFGKPLVYLDSAATSLKPLPVRWFLQLAGNATDRELGLKKAPIATSTLAKDAGNIDALWRAVLSLMA